MSIIDQIPDVFIEGFSKFISLNQESFNELYTNLKNVPIAQHPKKLAIKIAPLIKSIKKEDLQSILWSVGSLFIFRERKNISVSEIVEEVSRLILEKNIEGLKFEGDIENEFKVRLTKLLENEQLLLASKTTDIMTEYENVFLAARIISDIRPVFGFDTDTPKVGIIVHNLNIHYHQGESEEHSDIHLALDLDDLKKFKDVIERAEKKELALKTTIEKSGMSYLNISEEK